MVASTQHPKSLITVRCANLSPMTSLAELVALFTKEPIAIEDIKMRKNDINQTSSAFVTFRSMEDARRIIDKYNYWNLHDREMILMLVVPYSSFPEDANLFVKNVPKSFGNRRLYEIFKDFGPILSCKLSVDNEGESKGYGFVQFEDVESAEKAISALQGTTYEDKTLVISKFDKTIREHRKSDSSPQSNVAFTNVFVKNFPSSVTEEELKTKLETYGPVHSVYMPLKQDGTPVGFACVNFEKNEDAARAVEELHEKHVFSEDEDVTFYIQKAEKKRDREETIRRQMEALSLKGSQSKNNLYISHVPDALDEDDIREEFGKFGTVTSVKLQKSGPECNRQFGYVCFKTAEEAAKAYAEIGNTHVDYNKIHISFYKAKSERKGEGKGKTIETRDGSPFGASKLVHSLMNTLEKTASLYKKDWSHVGANNSTEFSQKMAKEFFSLGEKELQEMIASSSTLESRIRAILKGKKDKAVSKTSNQ